MDWRYIAVFVFVPSSDALFNSHEAMAEAIIGLLLVFFVKFLLRPYDVTIPSNLLFVHSFMQFQLKWLRDVIFRS